jgi:hypothetical protein
MVDSHSGRRLVGGGFLSHARNSSHKPTTLDLHATPLVGVVPAPLHYDLRGLAVVQKRWNHWDKPSDVISHARFHSSSQATLADSPREATSRTFTIAIGSIFIECNHFGGVPADIESFRRSELFYRAEVLERTAGTVGGMLRVLRDRLAAIRPLLVASACPSGPVTADCYRQLKGELLDRLRASLPVDGVLLALHVVHRGEVHGADDWRATRYKTVCW